jgi:hypothetical protein
MKLQKKITTALVALLVWVSGGTRSLLDLATDSAQDSTNSTGSSPRMGGGATCE